MDSNCRWEVKYLIFKNSDSLHCKNNIQDKTLVSTKEMCGLSKSVNHS